MWSFSSHNSVINIVLLLGAYLECIGAQKMMMKVYDA